MILRGGSDCTNYDHASVGAGAAQLKEAGLPHRVMIDCSHGNSTKDHKRQPVVAGAVAAQVAEGVQDVFGVMLESHLIEGNQQQQASSELVYGQSITDACIGWEDTVEVLEELAAAVGTQRKK